jgi:hypothetical protein
MAGGLALPVSSLSTLAMVGRRVSKRPSSLVKRLSRKLEAVSGA